MTSKLTGEGDADATVKKKSECQTKAGNQECFESVKFDPWDMLNNFCFHVYAQKSPVVRLSSLILGTCGTTFVFMPDAQK